MRSKKLSKEMYKLILFVIITITLFIVGDRIFIYRQSFSSGLWSISGTFIALSLIQIKRIITLVKNPDAYEKEQIDIKDERNIFITRYAKSHSYDIELFILIGIAFYALYINNRGVIIAVFILLLVRLASFLYYQFKGKVEF